MYGKKADVFWYRTPAGICIFMMKKRKRFTRHMMEIGFSKVFALKDISDISRTSMERELNKLTPQFLVGGEK